LVIKFDESLLTGISDIDFQHKFIFQAINSLEDTDTYKDEQNLFFTICEIEEYASKHFQTEEEYMIKYNYPAINEHISQHRDFTEKYLKLKEEFEEKGLREEYLKHLRTFLSEWIIKHYTTIDVKMAAFLRASLQKI